MNEPTGAKQIVFSKLTPRLAPLIFSAFSPGSVDMDRSAAWVALDREDKKTPIAALIFDSSTDSIAPIGAFRFRFIGDTIHSYADSFFEQVTYLAQRRGFKKIGCKGAIVEGSDPYELFEKVGFKSAERLEKFRVNGRGKIELICDDQEELYQTLQERKEAPKPFRVIPFKNASFEAVNTLVRESLGSARRELDTSPLNSIDRERSIVLLDENVLAGAALVRPYHDTKGFHVSALVVEENYRHTPATSLLSHEILKRFIEAKADYYSFETNPSKSASMVNHAKRYEFEHLGTSHFMIKDLEQATPC
ncbi:MAG: hypothetical protein ACSHYA_06440 [Opitutaceae bacterium]